MDPSQRYHRASLHEKFLPREQRHQRSQSQPNNPNVSYLSPAPSPRPGLRLSLHFTQSSTGNKLQVASIVQQHQQYQHPYTSTTPRHSSFTAISPTLSSKSSPSLAPFSKHSSTPSSPTLTHPRLSGSISISSSSSSYFSDVDSSGSVVVQNSSNNSRTSNCHNNSSTGNSRGPNHLIGKRPLSMSSLARISSTFNNNTESNTNSIQVCDHCSTPFPTLLQKQRPLSTPPTSSSNSSLTFSSPSSSSSSCSTPADSCSSSNYLSSCSSSMPISTNSTNTSSNTAGTYKDTMPMSTLSGESQQYQLTNLSAATIIRAFQTMDLTLQHSLLASLVEVCSTPQLTFLNSIIAPKLKRDFLRDLPLELAHHILSFIDDPQSLARVSQVSRFWHQLIETEDWVWRAQCIKMFGPTSCSSLPSPKSYIAPPTSFFYTTSPTSLDAVSSTLKALSNSSSCSDSSSNTPTSQSNRSSLKSCPGSRQSSLNPFTHTSSAWSNTSEPTVTDVLGNEVAATPSSSSFLSSSSSSSTYPTIPTNINTNHNNIAASLANQGSLSSSAGNGPSAAAPLFSTLPPSTVLRSSMSSRLAAASAIASTSQEVAPSMVESALPSSTSLSFSSSSQGLGVLSALSSLEGKKGAITATTAGAPLANGNRKIADTSSLNPDLVKQQPQQTTSYKAYFKRRYMIDRNWITGRHSLISNTTPETGVVTSLQFDHHHIVVGCDNRRIQIFETTTGRLLRTLQGHMGGVWALEFVKGVGASDEKILVSGGCDREVRVWDMDTGKCRFVMSGHNGTIRCLKLHQLSISQSTDQQSDTNDTNRIDSKHLYRHIAITGSRDSTLRVWDIQTGQNLFLLQGHTDSVRCIEVHGDILVSGSYDCTARVWSLKTGECLLHLQGHFQQIYSIAFNGEYIITGSLDSTCRLWSPITGQCLATLQGHTQLVGQLQLSGDSLMTGGGDGFMYLWNLRSMVCQYRVQAHDQSVTSLCFDSKRIVTGGNDGAVKLWDRQTGKFIRLLTKTDAAIWRVSICEERVVMCMQKNGRTAMEVMCFDSEAPILTPAISPDSQAVIT
ncbi:hypothetical protein BX616_002119 [Lobosporangium transversale]|uniref:WD40-repeat-containing domain protein n=1 Tax=Lobosporangium transversale TaxID=64571 RepID=A0A1Y2G911_9FUNG|nr:WD40-repeat-containing domain protein [Lobosporangium transversale]KAF9919066.1 hypothetical protein BX616_002119 [Lobosporangium transversale]ORZ04451.1 WD40-repeat-containing domain protein [Lobosporangium transversale]|eukprot:XP_021876559.1 WD40-repeat-containing domain protein [Lobosporangium transversale]